MEDGSRGFDPAPSRRPAPSRSGLVAAGRNGAPGPLPARAAATEDNGPAPVSSAAVPGVPRPVNLSDSMLPEPAGPAAAPNPQPAGAPAAAPSPGGTIRVNGRETPLPSPASVAGALRALGLDGPVAVEVNGALVRRAAHRETPLRPGDHLEVVTFVGGG